MNAQINIRPEMETITRKEIVALTGCSRSKVLHIINLKRLEFPQPISIIENEMHYNKIEVMEWLLQNDMKELVASGIVRRDPNTSTLDNKLATLFLSRKPTIRCWRES